KGLLLAVAAGALVAWPWSYRHSGRIDGERWTVETDRAEVIDVWCGWGRGRLGVGWGGAAWTKSRLDVPRRQAARVGAGWHWERMSGALVWDSFEGDLSWGPVNWSYVTFETDGVAEGGRRVSIPCWLLALA